MSSINHTTANQSSPTNQAPAPEPGPDWPIARVAWGVTWELHWGGIGAAFALLAMHSLIAILMADKSKAFTRILLFYAVNTLLFVLGMSRALYLWIDPYESAEHGFKCELWVSKAIFGIAFPCLTSAFCLIHVGFLEVSKMDLGNKKLHSIPFVSFVIVLHFCIVLVSDITVAIEADMKALLIVCQSFFIVWGFLNSIAFLYSGGRFLHGAQQTRKILREMANDQVTRSCNMSKVAKITLVTTVFGFLISGVQVYSMVGVYGMYSEIVNPAPWPWYIYQTGFRLVELIMGCCLAYTVTQPSERNQPSLVWRLICWKRTRVAVDVTSSTRSRRIEVTSSRLSKL